MKNNILNTLYTKRANAFEQARTFLDEHRTEEGTLSAEDNATYTRMEDEIQRLTQDIERERRAEQMEAEMARPVNAPILINPNRFGRNSDDAYDRAFLAALRSNFRHVSDVLVEGTDSAGGYLVPDEWDKRLIEKLDEENVIRSLATVIKTGGERKLNVAANKPAASWIEEGGELVFSDPSFSQVVLDAYKLSVAVKVSEELLADEQYNLKGFLINAFARAIGNAEEEAFLTGDGNHKPTGILHPTLGGQITTAAEEDSLLPDDIIDLIYKLKRPYRPNAAFITADSTLAQIRKLKDGNGLYIWQPALTAGEPDRLMGFPVYTSAYMPTVAGGQPVLAFGDFSFYNVADRGNRSFRALTELYAGNGQVGFVSTERVDGKLVLPEAVQVLKMAGTAANG